MRLSVISSTADILSVPAEPDIIAQKDSQLIYGEQFQLEKNHGAYVYGHSVLDGYKGYIEREQLAEDIPSVTSYVSVHSSHLYPRPSFKTRPVMALSFMSRLALIDTEENGFVQTHDGLWIYKDHVTQFSKQKKNKDLVQMAELYLGTPYYFGGRSSFGIDCAGLVQQTMVACGYDCPPRDSCDQEGAFGKEVKRDEIRRNDIVYFKGHVGIMVDEKNIINATARHMTTLIEPLELLEDAYEGGISCVVRL